MFPSKGYVYNDFKEEEYPQAHPKQEFITKRIQDNDLCASLRKFINDERNAAIEYKGFIAHHSKRSSDDPLQPALSEDEQRLIDEIARDETDHRAKLEIIYINAACPRID